MAGLACVGVGLTGCTTSREAYSQSSGISTYGVVDVGVERTSR
ncbi:membrane protein [Ralstonia solanacearum]|nr:membrane protein [Ralstonia solanacearum]